MDIITISKKDCVSGEYYRGRTDQRGMPIGVWSVRDNGFWCIKFEMMGPIPFLMSHIEDDDGFQCFDPIERLTHDPSLDVLHTQFTS